MLSAPVEAALSEMMRTQLNMTEQFLKSQRSLYENYCASLSRAAIARESRAKVRWSKRRNMYMNVIIKFLSSCLKQTKRKCISTCFV